MSTFCKRGETCSSLEDAPSPSGSFGVSPTPSMPLSPPVFRGTGQPQSDKAAPCSLWDFPWGLERCTALAAVALSPGLTLCLLGVTGQWVAGDSQGQPPHPGLPVKSFSPWESSSLLGGCNMLLFHFNKPRAGRQN